MVQDFDSEALLRAVDFGVECEAFRAGRLWGLLMQRKAALSQSLIMGAHSAEQLLVIRAKLDEIRGFEHAVRNGKEEKEQAEAALMEM